MQVGITADRPVPSKPWPAGMGRPVASCRDTERLGTGLGVIERGDRVEAGQCARFCRMWSVCVRERTGAVMPGSGSPESEVAMPERDADVIRVRRIDVVMPLQGKARTWPEGVMDAARTCAHGGWRRKGARRSDALNVKEGRANRPQRLGLR